MGKVESCESRPDLVGRRVCGDINVACNSNTCGVCALDETGETERVERRKRNHCPRRTVMGILGRSGCFCEWMVLPTRNLHVVPDGVTDEEACFAEPLAAALRVVEQQLVSRSHRRVAVLGDGKLGLLISAAMMTYLMERSSSDTEPLEVLACGRHAKKLDLLRGTAKAAASACAGLTLRLVDTTKEEGKEALRAAAGTCDCAVEATGSPLGFQQACSLLHPLGTLVLKTTCSGSTTLNTAPIVIDELKVVGSRCGPIDLALELLPQIKRHFDLTSMVEATLPLEDISRALERAREKGTLKVAVDMS